MAADLARCQTNVDFERQCLLSRFASLVDVLACNGYHDAMTSSAAAPLNESKDLTIGRNVRALMWEVQVTARTLAMHLGVDPTGLGRRLRGERGWSSDETYRAARIFGIPIGDLYEPLDPAAVAAIGAAWENRTPDLFITSESLYRLS